MKTLMTLVGAAALAAGILFVGQGWAIRGPASSLMIDQTAWVYSRPILAFLAAGIPQPVGQSVAQVQGNA